MRQGRKGEGAAEERLILASFGAIKIYEMDSWKVGLLRSEFCEQSAFSGVAEHPMKVDSCRSDPEEVQSECADEVICGNRAADDHLPHSFENMGRREGE